MTCLHRPGSRGRRLHRLEALKGLQGLQQVMHKVVSRGSRRQGWPEAGWRRRVSLGATPPSSEAAGSIMSCSSPEASCSGGRLAVWRAGGRRQPHHPSARIGPTRRCFGSNLLAAAERQLVELRGEGQRHGCCYCHRALAPTSPGWLSGRCPSHHNPGMARRHVLASRAARGELSLVVRLSPSSQQQAV